MVALGALVGPRLDIDVGTLSRLAYWVFGPAFVFALLAEADLDRTVVVKVVLSALAGMAAALAMAFGWARVAGVGYDIGAATAMTSAYGNVGNAGLAIVVFALGDGAAAVAALLMVTINMTGMILGVGLAQARSGSPWAALAKGLSAPMTIAAAFSLLVNLAGIDLPLLADRSVGLLSDALIPVMLITLGLQLVRGGRPSGSGDFGVTLIAKLAVAPTVAGLVAAALSLEGDALDAVIIQSAMPPAVFCAVIAIENDLVPERVTALVTLTTMVSAVTLPIVLLLVG